MLHNPPLLLPHPQELSAPATVLTFLLLRTRKEHPIDYKGKFLVSVRQDSPWPRRGAMASDVSSLAVGKERKAMRESGKTHPICREISKEKGGLFVHMWWVDLG